MDGKEAIINKIISDAEKKADEIISDFDARSRQVIDNANEWAENYKNTQREILDVDANNIVSRRKTVAELDAKKVVLKAKKEVIEGVFDSALKKLCSLNKADTLALIEKLLKADAEVGDKIEISADSPITEEDLKSLSVVKNKKLSYVGNNGNFKGGVYLYNDKCDKDLSFEALISSKKEDFESKIAEILF